MDSNVAYFWTPAKPCDSTGRSPRSAMAPQGPIFSHETQRWGVPPPPRRPAPGRICPAIDRRPRLLPDPHALPRGYEMNQSAIPDGRPTHDRPALPRHQDAPNNRAVSPNCTPVTAQPPSDSRRAEGNRPCCWTPAPEWWLPASEPHGRGRRRPPSIRLTLARLYAGRPDDPLRGRLGELEPKTLPLMGVHAALT